MLLQKHTIFLGLEDKIRTKCSPASGGLRSETYLFPLVEERR
ncbi:MAG: hypothetical protein UW70_C0030G0021 [Candidatus Peregrinibacteria bacterium GW2011_GWA2_44_7]|nr:MAG: hypothetical protein UW70_C0030G0021 [Candidatus Peregrinibacteria bacterium GW2011_GWA2_44_7]